MLILMVSIVCSAQQTIYDTISHDGLERSFILYVPPSYDPGTPAPLVINFHGYTSNSWEQMVYGDFRPIADTAGFLLVHPMGTLNQLGEPYWNSNWGGDVDDIGFTEALIDSLASYYNVNNDRVFSTGMSNGGFMSYTLACELSHRIAAIASVTGSMNNNQGNSCPCEHPMPIMEIHGTADGTVPYNGIPFVFESIPNTIAHWVEFNECNADPVITMIPDIDPNDGCTAEHYHYKNGLNGVEVEHYKIIDGGHTWPGAPIAIGVTNYDIDASTEIWKFFSQYDIYGKLNYTSISDSKPNLIKISCYPNPVADFLNINISELNIYRARLLNIQGLCVYEFPLETGLNAVSLQSMDSGLYFLEFIDNRGASVKIIKISKL